MLWKPLILFRILQLYHTNVAHMFALVILPNGHISSLDWSIFTEKWCLKQSVWTLECPELQESNRNVLCFKNPVFLNDGSRFFIHICYVFFSGISSHTFSHLCVSVSAVSFYRFLFLLRTSCFVSGSCSPWGILPMDRRKRVCMCVCVCVLCNPQLFIHIDFVLLLVLWFDFALLVQIYF